MHIVKLLEALDPSRLAVPPPLFACVLPQAFGYTSGKSTIINLIIHLTWTE
jgi:hypothetical protein